MKIPCGVPHGILANGREREEIGKMGGNGREKEGMGGNGKEWKRIRGSSSENNNSLSLPDNS